MTTWPKRLERELSRVIDDLPTLVADAKKSLNQSTYGVGVDLGMITPSVGIHAERGLLAGEPQTWGLLAATRRLRAYSVLLAPSPTAVYSAQCALSILEALQWDEIETAGAMAKQLQAALLGKLDMVGAAPPSESELEGIALALIKLRLPKLKILREVLEMVVDVSDFAGAVGLEPTTAKESFEVAFHAFWDLCEDGRGCVPRGARLSSAAVCACIQVRKMTRRMTAAEVDQALQVSPPPLRDFMNHMGARIAKEFHAVIRRAKTIVEAAGHLVN